MFYYRFAGNLLLSVSVNEFRKSFSTDKIRGIFFRTDTVYSE